MSKIFPKSANVLPLQIVVFLFVLSGAVTAAVTYYSTPKYLRVGYQPVQPVPFDHALHAGHLGIDCRYCHTAVGKSSVSSIPPAQTCMNCHSTIKSTSPLLDPVRRSFETGEPVPWVRVHEAPDYVFFDHSVHIARGISCVECHGKVNEMNVVWHDKSHSMGFCLDCHREPEKFVRLPADVFNLDSPRLADSAGLDEARRLIEHARIMPPQSCSGCHR